MTEKKIFLVVASIIFLFLVSLVFLAPDGYGGADSFQHYLISRYSWKHPHLLLDHWGKPVFTLLSSPFSHLGYKGLLFFNICVTLLSSYLVFSISNKLKEENATLSSIFFLLMPMVVLTAISALTEPLFGLVLVFSVWLFAVKRYFAAILVLSFLPLVRTEGFVVFPVFAAALLLAGKWKYLPLFVAGALIYSLVGYFALDDFFWLINRSPYKMEAGIYGSGPWYHFILNSWFIFGTPLVVLTAAGLWYYLPRNIQWLRNEDNILRIVIAGSFAAYFISHSYVWWKGTGGSLGLERVIAGVCPLAAIVALSGYNALSKVLKKAYISPFWFLIPFFLWIAKDYAAVAYGNLKQGFEQKIMTNAAEWIKANPETATKKFYYYNPHIAFLLDRDIFDRNEVEQLWFVIDEKDPLLWLQDGQFLVWDAHFGSNEGHTTLDKVIHKQNVQIMKRFAPGEQTQVLGGYDYEVIVFGKKTGWKDTLIEIIPDSTPAYSSLAGKTLAVAKENEYMDAFEEDVDPLITSEVVYLDVTLKYEGNQNLKNEALFFVFDMKCGEKSLVYNAWDLSGAVQQNSEMVLSRRYLLPPLTKGCTAFKAYFWNRGKVDVSGIKVETKLIHVPQNPK